MQKVVLATIATLMIASIAVYMSGETGVFQNNDDHPSKITIQTNQKKIDSNGTPQSLEESQIMVRKTDGKETTSIPNI